MSANFGRPGRPAQAKPDQDSSPQLQRSAKQSHNPLTPNYDCSPKRRTHIAQRRGAIDYGRRYGPLATTPDDDVGPENSNGGDEEERPDGILVKLEDPFKRAKNYE